MGREKMVRSLLNLRADPASWRTCRYLAISIVPVVPSKPSHFKAVVSALLDAAADPSSAVPGQPCLADGPLSRRHEDVAQLLFEARAAEERSAKRRRRDGPASDATSSSVPEEDSKKAALWYHIKPQSRRSSPIPAGENGQAENQALDPTSTYGDLVSESRAERCAESCAELRVSDPVWIGYVACPDHFLQCGTPGIDERIDAGS
ncbi:hypothetical protein AK812_SmicGene15195 [Symbiodinium microadriaticum]|uniref:Uncharacterized protein n=1 Tax=Symbiodinium microadriaticum TaxID=2951 RepID=A0A1Q9E3K7_SYMMI|nr:hypothetical protein AK812_SmicGene15195 [Symbiodinium microadriaticum]